MNRLIPLSILTVLLAVGCTKEEKSLPTAATPTSATQAAQTSNTHAAGKPRRTKVLDYNYDCPYGQGNCLDEVIVRSPRKLEDLRIAVQGGKLADLLNSDPGFYSDLTTGTDPDLVAYIDGIRKGTYNAVLKTDNPNPPANKLVLLIGIGQVSNASYEVELAVH